jgi:hypothetical protein
MTSTIKQTTRSVLKWFRRKRVKTVLSGTPTWPPWFLLSWSLGMTCTSAKERNVTFNTLYECPPGHLRREALEMPFMGAALQNELQQNMFSYVVIGYCEVQL